MTYVYKGIKLEKYIDKIIVTIRSIKDLFDKNCDIRVSIFFEEIFSMTIDSVNYWVKGFYTFKTGFDYFFVFHEVINKYNARN
jgi:hypothetical protein